MAMCDMCENYRYDEDLEEYFCDIELDEDEYLKSIKLFKETLYMILMCMNWIRWWIKPKLGEQARAIFTLYKQGRKTYWSRHCYSEV